MKPSKLPRFGATLVSASLLLALIVILAAYALLTINMPFVRFTKQQEEFLHANAARMLRQLEPEWNLIGPGEARLILPVKESRIWVHLAARQEKKLGISACFYDLDFEGRYVIGEPSADLGLIGELYADRDLAVELFFPFPANLDTLHQVEFLVDGEEPPDAQFSLQGVWWQTRLRRGEELSLVIKYRAQGTNSFAYALTKDRRSDVHVTIDVSGLSGSRIPEGFLPASSVEVGESGETFSWSYLDLIPAKDIRLDLPSEESRGQRLAQLQDSFRLLAVMSPGLVGLFILSLLLTLQWSGLRMRWSAILLIGCIASLFYPLLTFLSGLMELHFAAPVALLAVSCVAVAFAGQTLGWRQIGWSLALLLAVFLGAFSLGVFVPWRGLLATAGCLLLVAFFMLLHLRRSSAELERAPSPASAEPPEVTELQATAEAGPEPHHCPRCGSPLQEDYSYCPHCGRDGRAFHRCAQCGREQFKPAELEPVHCIHCGAQMS